jgi:large subunit ribosomal protein L10
MKKSQKFLTVDNLSEKLKQAKSLIFADYSGLKVDQINKLRQEIKKVGGEFEVIKNTLLGKAMQNAEWSREAGSRSAGQIENEQLKGPTAALWIYNDDISPLKVLDKFIKKNELPKIKLGFWGKESLDAEKIIQLANLPGLEELRVKLIGFLKSPLYQLTNALNCDIRKLVVILKTASTKVSAVKGGEN